MNLKRKFHQELSQFPTPASPIAETHRAPRTVYRPRKKWLAAPMAVAMAILLSVGVAAADVGVVQYLNRDILTENTLRLTEVPEGYVGIYSVEDLVQMRRDVEAGTGAANYILMSDITFTDADYAEGGICEGGWDPIDLQQYYYAEGTVDENGHIQTPARPEGYYSVYLYGGSKYARFSTARQLDNFNGNGYVIRNLRINADAAEAIRRNEYGYFEDLYLGLFGHSAFSYLEIINLGIEGCEITVTADSLDAYGGTIMIGAIAAEASYIGASYVKDLTVRVELDTAPYISPAGMVVDHNTFLLMVGGIAARSNYVDACYAENYTMDIRANRTNEHSGIQMAGGGIAAVSSACLTSWSDGTWNVSGDAYLSSEYSDILPSANHILFPTIMTEESFELMKATLLERLGADSFDYKKTCAYFIRKSLPDCKNERQYTELKVVMDQWNELYGLTTGTEGVYHDTLYIYDPTANLEERLETLQLLRSVFVTEEEYLAFCSANSIIVGELWCHTLHGESDMKETDFEGYDFSTLWKLTDGKPRLKIFE
ncbi:MAG: hypothetical protein IJW99_10215 [Clostridia bacterium]|nr:hypothetical protein [Clostridia bacterium]